MYERYCELRDAKGVKDSEVADALGITKSTFTGWKQGTLRPNSDKLYKIAKYFGTTVEYLLTGDDADYKDEYLARFDCKPEDFQLMKRLKDKTELWELLEAEKDLEGDKLQAICRVVRMIG